MTGAAIVLVIINSIIALYLFVKKCRQNSPFQFFYLSLFSLALFPGIWEFNLGFYDFHPFAPPINLSPDILAEVHVKILPMMVGFIIIDYLLDIKLGQRYISLPRLSSRDNLYDIIAALMVATLLAGVYIYGYGQISNSNFDELRSGSINRLFLVMFYLQILVVGIPGFYFLRASRPFTAMAVMTVFVLTYLLVGGSRQIIVMSSAVVLALMMMQFGRGRYVFLVLLFTVGFSSMDFLLQIIKNIRNLPSTEARIIFLDGLLSGKIPLSSITIDRVGSESTVRYVMYGFLSDKLPVDFGDLQYFGRTLLFWLPSGLDVLNIKPEDFEMVMFAEAMGNRKGTMHATFFGSAYADAQALAIIWVGWFSLMFKVLEQMMNRMPPLERSMVWGSCVYLSFMVSRGSFYAPTVVIAVALIVVWFSIRWRAMRGDGELVCER